MCAPLLVDRGYVNHISTWTCGKRESWRDMGVLNPIAIKIEGNNRRGDWTNPCGHRLPRRSRRLKSDGDHKTKKQKLKNKNKKDGQYTPAVLVFYLGCYCSSLDGRSKSASRRRPVDIVLTTVIVETCLREKRGMSTVSASPEKRFCAAICTRPRMPFPIRAAGEDVSWDRFFHVRCFVPRHDPPRVWLCANLVTRQWMDAPPGLFQSVVR